MNLVSADTQKLMDFVVYFNAVWVAPIEITLCLFFLWQVRSDASRNKDVFICKLLKYLHSFSKSADVKFINFNVSSLYSVLAHLRWLASPL